MPTTTISARQCMAARGLLDWTQDDLAQNAQVARATIASFEGKTRIEPARKNLLAIIAAFEAAGVLFIPENLATGEGAGVRLRKLELEYSNMLRPDSIGHDLIFPVRYKGQPCSVTIPREIIDDIENGNFPMPADKLKVVQKRLPQFVLAVEEMLRHEDTVPARITLSASAFPPGTF
jgi:DNA-binding XRE family transcriptional regulator